PAIGVFTNIGEAHAEGFSNIRQKIHEKLKLFLHSEVLVYNLDDSDISETVTEFISAERIQAPLKLFTWGKNKDAVLHIKAIEKKGMKSIITAMYKGELINCSIPFIDDAYIENAISCWCVLLYLNIPANVIEE